MVFLLSNQFSEMMFFLPHVYEGELKNPSVAIPKGTISAVFYTFTVYVLILFMVSATCNRYEDVEDSLPLVQQTDLSCRAFSVFLQDAVNSGLWVFAEDKPLATICHYWDLLRFSFSCDVLPDWSITYPPCTCCGSSLR